MKPLLIITFVISFLVGCSIGPGKDRIKAAKESESTGNPRPYTDQVQQVSLKLAWGSNYPDWDKTLINAVALAGLKQTVSMPCKKATPDQCLILALAKMAQFESSFKPETSYKESFKDSKGKNVISRGLLQLSIESANQSPYQCNIKKEQDLHDPKINLECAVKIAVRWINKDGEFFGGDKNGLGRYWSVGRKSSGSNKKIIAYLEQF